MQRQRPRRERPRDPLTARVARRASRLRSSWRWLLLLYPAAMALALTYFAEHYVIDAVAGAALALLVMVACTRWERKRAA